MYFCEINKTGEEHVMINTCLLNMLAKYRPSDNIEVWIDKTHFEHYRVKPQNLTYNYKHIIQPQKSNKLLWLRKLTAEIFLIGQIVYSAKANKARIVFFSSLSPVGNAFLSFILLFINSDTKFLVTLHGELELAKSHKWPKRIDNYYAAALRWAFRRDKRKLKYIILGEAIYNNVIQCKLLKANQLITIDHPYIFPEIPKTINSGLKKKTIVFGHLGVAKLSKQSELFFELAALFKEMVLDGTIRFKIVGQVFEEMKPFINEYVEYESRTDFILGEDYQAGASEVDYAVFFYNEKSYQFTSSGALLDAIAYEKPVIGLKIDALTSLFEKQECKPGYLFDEFKQLRGSMHKIIAEHENMYDGMVNCMKQKKHLYSIETQLIGFKSQVNDFLN